MYTTDIRNHFIEFRAKGWSLSRIAGELQVAQRTLVEWNRQEKQSIQELRAWELEAMQEKILATHEQELRLLKHHLDIVEFRIFQHTHEYQSLSNLYKMASLIRSEIRKVCDHSSRHLSLLDSDPISGRTPARPDAQSSDAPPTDTLRTDSCHQQSTINEEPPQNCTISASLLPQSAADSGPSIINDEPSTSPNNCTISASELPQAEKTAHSDSLDPGSDLSTPPAESLTELSTVNCSETASELPHETMAASDLSTTHYPLSTPSFSSLVPTAGF